MKHKCNKTKELNLSYVQEDNNNCRVYFRSETRSLYCFQLATRHAFELFECTRDGEPLGPINMDMIDVTLNSTAPGSTKIGTEFLNWHMEMTQQPPSP